MHTKQHWETVYTTKTADAVSWFQPKATLSLQLIEESGVDKVAPIIDIGGGASVLVDQLMEAGYSSLHVLDISEAALNVARDRLGGRASAITWWVEDITTADLPAGAFEVWHDRAVFHFLIDATQRAAYKRVLLRALKPGGHLIIATFDEHGPQQCSGLPVQRYSAAALQAEFGTSFTLLTTHKEDHLTPAGKVQQFVYCHFRRKATDDPVHRE